MYSEPTARIILAVGLSGAVLLLFLVCICICKDFYDGCVRERNRIATDDDLHLEGMEMLSPEFIDAARAASFLAGALSTARRRQLNLEEANPTGNVSNNENEEADTHFTGEASVDTNAGEVDQETENKPKNVKRKRRVTFNLGDDKAGSSKDNDDEPMCRDKSDGKASGDDKDDTVDLDEASGKDNASGSSTGGGDTNAPSPWVDF